MKQHMLEIVPKKKIINTGNDLHMSEGL